jgi:phosphoserine aminotransferase
VVIKTRRNLLKKKSYDLQIPNKENIQNNTANQQTINTIPANTISYAKY